MKLCSVYSAYYTEGGKEKMEAEKEGREGRKEREREGGDYIHGLGILDPTQGLHVSIRDPASKGLAHLCVVWPNVYYPTRPSNSLKGYESCCLPSPLAHL